MKKFGCYDPKIMALAPRTQRNIMEALMKACMQVPDQKTKEEFQTQVKYQYTYFLNISIKLLDFFFLNHFVKKEYSQSIIKKFLQNKKFSCRVS